MAVGRVVVHDVGELEAFGSTLQLKRDEIEGFVRSITVRVHAPGNELAGSAVYLFERRD